MSAQTILENGRFTRQDPTHEAQKALEAFPELAYSDGQVDSWVDATLTGLDGAKVVLKRLVRFNLGLARVTARLYLELRAKNAL